MNRKLKNIHLILLCSFLASWPRSWVLFVPTSFNIVMYIMYMHVLVYVCEPHVAHVAARGQLCTASPLSAKPSHQSRISFKFRINYGLIF